MTIQNKAHIIAIGHNIKEHLKYILLPLRITLKISRPSMRNSMG